MDSPKRLQTENSGYRGKTDEELILICAVDHEAFGELARRYRPMAFRAAFCVMRNALDAEDQVQSALSKAFERIGKFRGSARFSTWLVRIVINECLMQLRRTRHISFVSCDGSSPEILRLRLTCEMPSPERAAATLSMARLLKREIRRIPPLLRNAFILRDVQQRPMPEVAKRLGISIEAAKSRLSRAREELRKRLEPHICTAPCRPEVSYFKDTRKETII
jgi:RNA polymerase sigma-70 factor (ECF subfamily)